MQVKCKVFSRFGSSVDFSSGEPLGGVEAPTVGADLCVRPSSPERSLFCGRTRRSAPTQATSARQFHSSNAVTPTQATSGRQLHSSNAVTPISVGADLCVRPSSPERSLFCGRTHRSAPTKGYTYHRYSHRAPHKRSARLSDSTTLNINCLPRFAKRSCQVTEYALPRPLSLVRKNYFTTFACATVLCEL